MKKYLSPRWVTRILAALVVILALAAGYYQVLYEGERIKYLRLEDKFVRVRQQLGREETQRLIEGSYQ